MKTLPLDQTDSTKSLPKSSGKSVQSEEPVFEVADLDLSQDQEGNLGDNEDEPRDETASRRDWFKKPTPPQEPTDPNWNISKTTQEGPTQNWLMTLATSTSIDKSLKDFDELMSTPINFSALSEKLDWENPEGGDYPFDLSKPLPLITRGNHQRSKATKYDLPGIEDMVPNIWSLVKVAYDRYALWGISHWREQRKSFYAYARGIRSRGDVYSTKRILAITHVKVMRKNRYEYLEEIVVRRADNNWLINLLGDDVADFAIALKMFTRSLVI
ncbi:hypothetical protein Tco_1528627 [Tanacetum coccineum]